MKTIVLWNDKPYKVGDVIIGMEMMIYDNLHWSYRRLRSCNYWKEYRVTDLHPLKVSL